MKRCGSTAVWVAGGLALNACLLAADSGAANNPSPDNPYAPIVVRNVFSLNPPPPPEDPKAREEKELPKITPSGIMNYFGHLKVLYKVAAPGAKPGQPPPKDSSYILSQGERQDDVEVIKIDEANSLVTFSNHGFTQELPLVSTPASSTPAASPAPAGPGTVIPGLAPGRAVGGTTTAANNGNGGFITFGSGAAGRNGSTGNGSTGLNNQPGFGGGGIGGANGANNGLAMNFGGNAQGRVYQPEPSQMTPEQSVIAIEAQRALYQQEGSPLSNVMPPTPITHLINPQQNPE